MKRIILSILLQTILVSSTFAAVSGNRAANNLKRKKIFISEFTQIAGRSGFVFFRKAFPRSIKTTLSRKHKIKYQSTPISREKLLAQNYDFLIKGKYSVINNELTVEFEVIHIKKKIVVIKAKIKGFPDTRVFRLVDKIVDRIKTTIEKRLSLLLTKTVILRANRQGHIQEIEILRGKDLRNRSFRRADLRRRDIRDADLRGVDLSYANLSGADLRNSDLRGANLTGANFSSANFETSAKDFIRFFFRWRIYYTNR